MAAERILIVEDEAHIAEGLKVNLEMQGYEVRHGEDGKEGLKLWRDFRPDLIILDLMMPEVDGHKFLKTVRESDERLPIFVLSAKDQMNDKIESLAGGVDDYLVKPFNLDEFLLRVERLLRRSRWSHESDGEKQKERVYFGENWVDFSQSRGGHREEEFSLTAQELKVLDLFFKNSGVAVSREKLLEEGWGYDQKTSTRTVDNFIVRLRKYFEDDPKSPAHFKSLRSVGYLFEFGN